jgi:PAS domain S-box-containing protein
MAFAGGALDARAGSSPAPDELHTLSKAFDNMAAALEENQERLCTIADYTYDWEYWIGPDGRPKWVSPSCERITGYRASEFMSDYSLFQTIVYDDDKNDFNKHLILEQDMGQSGRIDFRIRHRSGRLIWIEHHCLAIENPSGKLLGRRVSNRDITERKNMEQALRQSEAQFRSLVEGAPVAIFVQVNSCFVYVNTAGLRLFGADTADQLIGTPVMDRFHTDYREKVSQRIYQLNELKKPVPRIEQIYLRLDKTPVPVEVSAVPITFEGQNGALVFVQDITERRQIETRLQQAQKMEAIGALAGGIAHDFNNILTPVIGLSELLLEDLPPGSLERENVIEINTAARRAGDLVRQILSFSRQAEQKRIPLRIQQVLKEVGKLVRSTPDITQAAWRIEQSRAMLDLTQAAFWPKASFYTEYMQGDAPSAYLFKKIDQRMLPPDANFNDPGWFENFESGLRAQMNLFNGGRDYLELQMAEKGVDISKLSWAEVRNNLCSEVIGAFYNALAARDFVTIAQQSVKTVSEQLRVMQVRYEGGAVVKSDILSMEVRLARAEEQLVSGKNRFRLAAAALANLMGIEAQRLTDSDKVFADKDFAMPELPDSYETGLKLALQNRPELARVREQVVKSRYALAAAKATYLPSLDLMAKYYLDDPDMHYDQDRENWTAALVFNWDLFTGFTRPAMISRADASLKELLAADKKTMLGIELDVKRAYLNFDEALCRHEVAKKGVKSAEESFRLVKEHYQGGAVTITRYLEAEFDLRQARIRSTAAYYDKIKAQAEIARSIGLWTKNKT